MKLHEKYLVSEANTDWEPLLKKIAKKMREPFGQDADSQGFVVGYDQQTKGFNDLMYFQDGGQMRSDGSASTHYIIPPNTTPRDLEMAMKKMLKDPKIQKMKKAFSRMAQGQADYYSKRPMKNWPGI